MARTAARARPEREEVMVPERKSCPGCGSLMRLRYDNHRTLMTLSGAVRLRLEIRRCERDDCACYRRPGRPEAEGAVALPQHEFGLDVVALVGVLRHRDHRSVPEIHAALRGRGVDRSGPHWQDYRDALALGGRTIVNMFVPTLDAPVDTIGARCCDLTERQSDISSRTNFSWWPKNHAPA